MDVLTATAVFFGVNAVRPSGARCDTGATWAWIKNSGDAALIGAGVFDFGSDWRQCNGILLLLHLQSRSRVINQCILFVALPALPEHFP